MRGAYTLIIRLPKNTVIHIKSLGKIPFEEGNWIYVGSAMGIGSTNLENRIRRHFRTKKTIHWHIDHLLATEATIHYCIWAVSTTHMECEIGKGIEKIEEITPGPKGFGASDCKKKCWTHLYHSKAEYQLEEKVQLVFKEFGLEPKITWDGIL